VADQVVRVSLEYLQVVDEVPADQFSLLQHWVSDSCQ
jgi:hypothetical protein